MASDAFNMLPERWRLVLWHRVVLGHSTEQVSREMETTPTAVAALLVDVTSARLVSQPCVAISSAWGATFLSFDSQTERPWRCARHATTILCRPEGDWWRSAGSDPAREFDQFVTTRTSATDERSPMVYVINQTEDGFSVEPVAS